MRFRARYCRAYARKIIFEARNEFAIVENIYLARSHNFFTIFLSARTFTQSSFTRVHVRSSNYSKKVAQCNYLSLIQRISIHKKRGFLRLLFPFIQPKYRMCTYNMYIIYVHFDVRAVQYIPP